MRTLTVASPRGGKLAVIARPGERRPYLLVHGLASHAGLWDEVAEALASAGHPVYALDLLGHGGSDPAPAGYGMAGAVADAEAVLDLLGLDGPVLVGQSWGGNVVVRLAASRPAHGLALVDGGWIDLPADFGSWAACAATLRPADVDGQTAEALRERIRAAHPDWSERAVDATVASLRTLPDGTVERRLPVEAHMRIVRSVYDDPPHRHLPQITAPTLLLPAIPSDPGRAARVRRRVAKAAAHLRQPTVREYLDADHDLHAQHPARLAEDLLTLAGPS
ncbi:alpha/beta hydrolase [Pilimelia columellifera]|uniref:Lipase LipV n=1 Tax=Pilimelia columellifera subsp. columellifera TaxID=706583 RepID=A0ABN3NJZ9_9ACTN